MLFRHGRPSWFGPSLQSRSAKAAFLFLTRLQSNQSLNWANVQKKVPQIFMFRTSQPPVDAVRLTGNRDAFRPLLSPSIKPLIMQLALLCDLPLAAHGERSHRPDESIITIKQTSFSKFCPDIYMTFVYVPSLATFRWGSSIKSSARRASGASRVRFFSPFSDSSGYHRYNKALLFSTCRRSVTGSTQRFVVRRRRTLCPPCRSSPQLQIVTTVLDCVCPMPAGWWREIYRLW